MISCPNCTKNIIKHEKKQLILCFVRHNIDSDKGSILPKVANQLKRKTLTVNDLAKINKVTNGAAHKIIHKLKRFDLLDERKYYNYETKSKKPSSHYTLNKFGRMVFK